MFPSLARGLFVAEKLLRRQMFPSLTARETHVAETNFAARKQENVSHAEVCVFPIPTRPCVAQGGGVEDLLSLEGGNYNPSVS